MGKGALTCMPKALMATEMGPFLASQAASSEMGGAMSGVARLCPLCPLALSRPSLTVLVLAQRHRVVNEGLGLLNGEATGLHVTLVAVVDLCLQASCGRWEG